MNLPPPSAKHEAELDTALVTWEGNSALNAMLMSLVAGLSTSLGGCVVCCVSSVSSRILAFTLSLAAGVMTSVSILELMKPLRGGAGVPFLWAVLGSALYAWLRQLLPESTGAVASDHKRVDDGEQFRSEIKENSSADNSNDGRDSSWRARQWRLGVLMMATLTAHNLPEGVAVAVGALKSPRTGLVVMSAVAMHNIPEGLAIAIPIYAATGSRWRALGMTLASGLSEPLGAGLGLAVLKPFLTPSVVDNAACAVGGIMLAVSLLELAPESIKHQHPVSSLAGLLSGWVVIALTVKFA